MIKMICFSLLLVSTLYSAEMPIYPEKPTPMAVNHIDPEARTIEFTRDHKIDFKSLLDVPHLEHLILNYQTGYVPEEQWEIICKLSLKSLSLHVEPTPTWKPPLSFKNLKGVKQLLITNPERYSDEQWKELNALGIPLILHGKLGWQSGTIHKLDSIESLTLMSPYNSSTDIVLRHAQLPRLKYLRIAIGPKIGGFSQLEEAEIDHFAPNLVHLDVRNSDFSDLAVSRLQSMKSLEEVYLSRTAITANAIPYLTKIPNLKVLDLSGNSIKGADFSLFTQLESLDVSGTDITLEDLQTLRELKQLKELKIEDIEAMKK